MGESFGEVPNRKLRAEKKNLQSDWLEEDESTSMPGQFDKIEQIPQPIPRKAIGIDPDYKPEVGRSPSRYFESKITSGKQFVDAMKAEECSAMNEDAEDYQAAGLMINGFLGLMKRYGGSSCGRRIPDQYLRGQFIYSQESYWQNNVPVQTNMRGQRNFYDYNMQPAQNYFRNYLMQQNSNMQNFHCRAPHHSYALPPGVRPEPRNGY